MLGLHHPGEECDRSGPERVEPETSQRMNTSVSAGRGLRASGPRPLICWEEQ